MEVIKFEGKDTEQLVKLFYDTVHSVNSRDYSAVQLDAWAPIEEKNRIVKSWRISLSQNITYVVKIDQQITGFSDLTCHGYLNRLYIHKDHQRKGIATALINKMELEARKMKLEEIKIDASITARPFFESHGYRVIRKQTVKRKGVILMNYYMVKLLI